MGGDGFAQIAAEIADSVVSFQHALATLYVMYAALDGGCCDHNLVNAMYYVAALDACPGLTSASLPECLLRLAASHVTLQTRVDVYVHG